MKTQIHYTTKFKPQPGDIVTFKKTDGSDPSQMAWIIAEDGSAVALTDGRIISKASVDSESGGVAIKLEPSRVESRIMVFVPVA